MMPEQAIPYRHEPTPKVSPLVGGHPILTPVSDAIDHLAQAAESDAAVSKAALKGLLAMVKHYVAFLEVKARD